MTSRTRLLLAIGPLLALLALLAAGHAWLPWVGPGTYRVDGHPPQPLDLPLELQDDVKTIEATFPLHVSFLRPHRIKLIPDDCVQRVEVNGQVLRDPGMHFCDYIRGREFDLSPYLHTGDNEVKVTVSNAGGPSGLDVTLHADNLFAWFALALLVLAAWAAILIFLARRASRRAMALLAVFFGGATLRVLYVFATPPNRRGHDWSQHLEYIRFVATHGHLPPAHAGFEFYQPPLYYVLMTPLLWRDVARGAVGASTLFHLQLVSLLFSLVTLGVALATIQMLFAGRPCARLRPCGRGEVVLAGGLFAAFSGLIFFAPRINNDALLQLVSFVTVAFLIRYSRSGRALDFIAFSACVALGILTKTSAFVCLAAGFGYLALRRGPSLKEKAVLMALGLGIVGAVAGWFVVRRVLEDRHAATFLVANKFVLSPKLVLPNTLAAFVGFHPTAILQHPYNDPWRDASGRRFMWDYFVRSALFGEFDFGPKLLPLCRVLLGLFGVVCLIGLLGWWRSARTRFRQDLPVHLLLFLSLGSQAAFRALSPFSVSQDFRYSFLLVLPFAYFVAFGLRGVRRWPRRIMLMACGSFIVCSAAFIVAVWVATSA